MVSLWPWRKDDSSTASFEKTLSTLSTKITSNQARLDKLRASSRRVRVLWTLNLSFAYLVYAIVLLLVIGYQNMGAYEWGGLAGGPFLIYGTRALLSTYYSLRIESFESRLKEDQEERAKTIQKLKDATKYDSTMELIEKYGGQPQGKSKKEAADEKDSANSKTPRQNQGPSPNRLMVPPPTANIQRPPSSGATGGPPQPPHGLEPTAEFAPNAEYAQSPPHQAYPGPPPPPQPVMAPPETHWYDRIFDALLGEDEAAPKNRIVLICQSCHLVNGQAPPGSRTLADVGLWRCMACGANNGELEDEGRRIVREVLDGRANGDDDGTGPNGDEERKPEDTIEVGGDEKMNEEATGATGIDGPAAAVGRRRGAKNI
jgi:hypothetical protein